MLVLELHDRPLDLEKAANGHGGTVAWSGPSDCQAPKDTRARLERRERHQLAIARALYRDASMLPFEGGHDLVGQHHGE
jgi:hypothetical protein